MALTDRVKQLAWLIVFPVFPLVRDTLSFFGVIRHEGRQDFQLGWLHPERTAEAFRQFLASRGFKRNRIAWVEDGEIIGLRLKESFRYQYHVRVFYDGEVRAHYELTPEYRPVAHVLAYDLRDRRGELLELFGNWLVPERDTVTDVLLSGSTMSQRAPATFRDSPTRG